MTNEEIRYILVLIEDDIKKAYSRLRTINQPEHYDYWEYCFDDIQAKTKLQNRLRGLIEF